MAQEQEVTERGIEKPKSEWQGEPSSSEAPIDRLKPGSKLHNQVLHYLVSRIETSERAMSDFYARWRANEKKTQAYIDLPDWEAQLQQMNDQGKPPKVVSITVPYNFAVISTIVTYLVHTFTGRKPIFQVGSYKQGTVDSARMMETVLQYNADNTRLIKHLFQYFQDAQEYGLGVLRVAWKNERQTRTVIRERSGILPGTKRTERSREEVTTYKGNEVYAQDPFLFFPDPRVPMHEVNKRGEYVFWRNFDGRHWAKRMEAAGEFKWVDAAKDGLPRNVADSSARADKAQGVAIPGENNRTDTRDFLQVDQGTVDLIPQELGLGDSAEPQKWQFTILNKSQIVQAEPLGADHGMHPVAVTEPYTKGNQFGSIGMSDMIGPLQDTVSWLINSHMDNVRKVLNDSLIVDPSGVEMQDLRENEPGKLIRLSPGAQGRDVREVVQQLSVQDVTRQHINDMELFIRLGQMMSGVTENVMGLQSSSGRKTATEVRTSSEAAASRLAAQARIISAQGIVDLTEMMAVNNQQYLDEDFYLQIVGEEGRDKPLHVTPEHIAGNFYYPTHDGTLPLDRVAMLDIWKQIFQTVLADPGLRQEYSVPRMFEWIAELGGARNIDAMKMNIDSEENIEQRVAENQLATPGEAAQGSPGSSSPAGSPSARSPQPSGQINPTQGNSSAQRLAEELEQGNDQG